MQVEGAQTSITGILTLASFPGRLAHTIESLPKPTLSNPCDRDLTDGASPSTQTVPTLAPPDPWLGPFGAELSCTPCHVP